MDKILYEGLTFDDVLLVPQYADVLPAEVSLKTKLTDTIELNLPLMSAGMDTVSEADLAAALALEGGIGIIHKSMTAAQQAEMVSFVKEADAKDSPNAALDAEGRPLCGAAIGVTPDVLERVAALRDVGVDVVAVDSAHGHSVNVIKTVERVKQNYPGLQVIAGNIATAEAAKDLISAGADCLKVGMGPGAICTTRIVAGIGVPQITAVMQCAEEAARSGVRVIADGGIKYSGDIVKAIAAGASVVMIGSLFAGADESPGQLIEYHGKKFKAYRGMGSTSAMQRGGGDRYFQSGSKKFVPEGVEGLVPYRGSLSDIVYQMAGGLRAGMGYCGAHDIEQLRLNGRFVKITGAGLSESHPHDLFNAGEEPNYRKTTD